MENRSEQINEISAALAKAQGEITCAIEDKINPHFKSSYASLNSIFNACRSQLSKNGICIVQSLSTANDMYVLTTLLAHSSGQWMSSQLPFASLKCTPQALGSALTYFKRYSLSAMTGVSSGDDDDANSVENEVKREIPNRSKPIELIKAEGYENFCNLHGIKDGSPIMTYIESIILNKKHLSKIGIINAALRDSDRFFESFEEWKKHNNNE